MNDIYLKKVEGKDVNFLYQLMNNTQIRLKLHECETTPKLWEDALLVWNDDTDEENYIICLDGNSIGWIGINGLDSINKKAFIKIIAIYPAYQSKGFGTQTILYIKDYLRQLGYSELFLYTDCSNNIAQRCYKKCGFSAIKKVVQKMSDGSYVERYMMKSDLFCDLDNNENNICDK